MPKPLTRTIYFPDSVAWLRAQRIAALREESVSQVIAEALKAYIESNQVYADLLDAMEVKTK